MDTKINNKQAATEPVNGDRINVGIGGVLKAALDEIRIEYSYPTFSAAAMNAAAVGYEIWKSNPDNFLQILKDSKIN